MIFRLILLIEKRNETTNEVTMTKTKHTNTEAKTVNNPSNNTSATSTLPFGVSKATDIEHRSMARRCCIRTESSPASLYTANLASSSSFSSHSYSPLCAPSHSYFAHIHLFITCSIRRLRSFQCFLLIPE